MMISQITFISNSELFQSSNYSWNGDNRTYFSSLFIGLYMKWTLQIGHFKNQILWIPIRVLEYWIYSMYQLHLSFLFSFIIIHSLSIYDLVGSLLSKWFKDEQKNILQEGYNNERGLTVSKVERSCYLCVMWGSGGNMIPGKRPRMGWSHIQET